MDKIQKKGQFGNIGLMFTVVIVILIASIVLSAGNDILANFKEDQSTTSLDLVNTTVTGVVGTNVSIGYANIVNSTVIVTNATSGDDVDVGLVSTQYVITTFSDSSYYDCLNTSMCTVNVSFTYGDVNFIYNISGQGMEGLNELGSWLDTIAIVLAAVIIIGLLLFSFGKFM